MEFSKPKQMDFDTAKSMLNALAADRRALVDGRLPAGQNRFSQVALRNEAERVSRDLHNEALRQALSVDPGMEEARTDEAFIADRLLDWIEARGTAQGFNQANALEIRRYLPKDMED